MKGSESPLLMVRIDVLIGLLRTVYERYYARQVGLEVGESRSLLVAIKKLEADYEENMQRLYEQQNRFDTETLKGMN